MTSISICKCGKCDCGWTKESDADLLAEFVLDVLLDTTQHERLQDHMQTTKLTLIQLAAFVLRGSGLDIFREPLIELVVRVEQAGHDEVQ